VIAARIPGGLGAGGDLGAALSILRRPFTECRERNIRVSRVWGCGRRLRPRRGRASTARRRATETLSWSWKSIRQVPVARGGFSAPAYPAESRDTTVKSFDALGAVLADERGSSQLGTRSRRAADTGWG